MIDHIIRALYIFSGMLFIENKEKRDMFTVSEFTKGIKKLTKMYKNSEQQKCLQKFSLVQCCGARPISRVVDLRLLYDNIHGKVYYLPAMQTSKGAKLSCKHINSCGRF
jgi:hypothetical protein